MKNRWRAISPALLTASAALGGIVAFSDRLDAFFKSNAILYGLAAIDMFRLELVLLIVGFIAGPAIVNALSRGVQGARHLRRNMPVGHPARTETVVIILSLSAVTLIGAYYGARYAIGKTLQLRRYEETLSWRVRERLAARDVGKALSLARIGSLVFRNKESSALRELIETRNDEIRALRNVYATLPLGSVGALDLLQGVCSYALDNSFCVNEVSRIDGQFDAVESQLAVVAAAISTGTPSAAQIDELTRVCKDAPSIGACGVLIGELSGDIRPTVHVDALRRHGAVEYVRQVMAPSRNRLTSIRASLADLH